MPTPAPLTGPPEPQISEAATPGASVAAVRGEHDHVLLETPEFDTPGQASPAAHRSPEGGRSLGDGAAALDSSRGRSAGLHTAAVAALAEGATTPAAAAPAVAAEPLSKPRLRVQGADIILEDAASPKDAAENGGGAVHRPPQEEQLPAAAAAGAAAQAGAAAGGAWGGASAAAQQPTAQLAQTQPSQQPMQLPPLNLAAAMRVSQTHEHELQLRLASRTATGVSNMAIASTRQAATQLPQGDDSRLRGHDAGAGGGEAGPASGGGSSAMEGPVRMKYRSTLTEENVAYLNKLDQYATRPDATGRSSDRIWRWLEGSGPPFDNPPPSLGVPTVSKTTLTSASRRQGTKRSFFSCFNCFSGSTAR